VAAWSARSAAELQRGSPLQDLSAMVGRQLPFFSVLVPFRLVAAMVGLRRMRQVWPACLTAGLSFAIVQVLVSNLHGPWLVDGEQVECRRPARGPPGAHQ
jgi:L-lactate permease